MKIGGFQRFSLLDYPGQMAAIVFAQGCNFRCPYCHNPELVDPARFRKLIPNEYVLEFLSGRKGKLTAVTITGGEPTLQPGLRNFIHQVKVLGYLVKVDTNGSNPDLIKTLVEERLVDYWAMDIKAPLHLYQALTRCDTDPNLILRSIGLIRESSVEYEFRTTFWDAMFDWQDLSQIKELLRPGDRFYLQECRLDNTLDDLKSSSRKGIGLSDKHLLHLMDHPECRDLIKWGNQHQVSVHIRTL
jgi:pyruvate formate lyase activating enzyme